MLSKSFLEVKKYAYTYLGYKKINTDDLDIDIDKCLYEIEDISQFRYIYVEFNEIIPFLNHDSYKELLKNCDSYYLILTTLGNRIDEKIKYYSKFDLKKSIIFDACASAYLEYLADKYENDNFIENRTYRFCPGYQNTSVKDIRIISDYINFESIGVRLLDSNLMIPQKSMCGIIGLGSKNKKSCKGCILFDSCNYRKEGNLCYKS